MPYKSSGSGIYCIKNNINGKVYIGQAYRLERRLYDRYIIENELPNPLNFPEGD